MKRDYKKSEKLWGTPKGRLVTGMVKSAQLMGFAFTNADFLFEIDRKCTIGVAIGAASEFAPNGSQPLVGRSASSLFQPSDGSKFATFVQALGKGDRAGPFRLKLIDGKEASVAMFRLPENGDSISCTLTKLGKRSPFAGHANNPKSGLPAKDGFLAAAADIALPTDTLTMVEISDLPALCAKLPQDSADALLRNIGAAINATGAKAAGHLSDTSFGIVAEAHLAPATVIGGIQEALAAGGIPSAQIRQTLLALKGQTLSSDQRLLAMRYVVDRFTKGRGMEGCTDDLSGAFSAMIDETQERALSLTKTVADGKFQLLYQPIKNLKSGATSHFEALARFGPGNTGETIIFAEAMGIANAFDLAVALRIITIVEAEKTNAVSIAFNISGDTLASASSFSLLAGFLARNRALAPRILIEITETAEISDLDRANTAIAALRAMGYRVGLDDFGSGACALNYLHALAVDFVKFDGTLVKKIGLSKRDDTLLRSMVKLCGELGIETIAECLETEAQMRSALEMGFDLGQGYYLGKPEDLCVPPPRAKPTGFLGRRKGVRENWG